MKYLLTLALILCHRVRRLGKARFAEERDGLLKRANTTGRPYQVRRNDTGDGYVPPLSLPRDGRTAEGIRRCCFSLVSQEK